MEPRGSSERHGTNLQLRHLGEAHSPLDLQRRLCFTISLLAASHPKLS